MTAMPAYRRNHYQNVYGQNVFASLINAASTLRPPAWKNGCDSLSVVGLHENWTLTLRFQVSGVRRENARVGLKPDTRHLKPMLGEGFITPDNVQKKELFS
jgi:hypothetical protein